MHETEATRFSLLWQKGNMCKAGKLIIRLHVKILCFYAEYSEVSCCFQVMRMWDLTAHVKLAVAMSINSSWRIDDMDSGLDGGLASELLNLSGLGNEFGAEGAYNMRY